VFSSFSLFPLSKLFLASPIAHTLFPYRIHDLNEWPERMLLAADSGLLPQSSVGVEAQ
jgi:hypothetical protein